MAAAAAWLMAAALAVSPLYDCVPATATDPFTTCFRTHVGPLPTTLLELVLLPAIALGLLAGGRHLPWRNPYTWPALLLLAAAAVAVLVASDRRAALGLWRAYFAEPIAAALVIAWLARTGRTGLLLGGLAAGGAIAAAANLAAFALVAAHGLDPVHPPVALYRTPNATALFLVPLTVAAAALALYGPGRGARRAAGLLACLYGAAALASLSRGGWLALVAGLAVVGLFHPRRRLLVGAPALTAAALVAGLPPLRRRMATEFDFHSPDNTVASRLAIWRSDLNLLRHRPLTGAGLGGFQREVQPYADPGFREQVIDPHSLLLNWWTETGLLGLAAFVWLLVQAVRTAAAGLAARPPARALAVALLGVLATVAVQGLVDVPYFKNDLALQFWALLALQYGACAPLRAPDRDA